MPTRERSGRVVRVQLPARPGEGLTAAAAGGAAGSAAVAAEAATEAEAEAEAAVTASA
jgi:hypothetical protein